MSAARYLVGDVFAHLAAIPDGSIDLVLTSPPFLALRSYLPDDHPGKALEIGSEADPASWLDVMYRLTAEWRRVLAPHGSIVVELGDTYAGNGGQSDRPLGYLHGTEPPASAIPQPRSRAVDRPQDHDGPTKYARVQAEGLEHPIRNLNGKAQGGGDGWPLSKSLCGIPHLYWLGLAYGRNLLTGEPSPAGLWRVRNVVAWCRPNPPVGALSDKFRPATSFLTVACVGERRYWDAEAVRGPSSPNTHPSTAKGVDRLPVSGKMGADGRGGGWANGERHHLDGGSPPLDWWEITPSRYAGAHYAVFPSALLERPVKAMCPQRVCRTCGAPSTRITSEPEYLPGPNMTGEGRRKPHHGGDGGPSSLGIDSSVVRTVQTLGWTDCGHDDWRRGVVLDPFAGSGTTLAVATGHGRDAIGIDLDERNADLAQDRVGMFLTVET